MLLTADGHVRITDCGLARALGDETATQTHGGGTRGYMAPEVATQGRSGAPIDSSTPTPASEDGLGYDGFAADVWSVGVCCFAMLHGFFPFDSSDPAVDWRALRVLEAQRGGECTIATIGSFYEGRLPTALSPAAAALPHGSTSTLATAS